MKTIKKPIIIATGIVAIGFILALIFISLLGELNKVNESVENFFLAIREQKYHSQEENMISVANLDVFDTKGDFSQNCFLLELSLLEYYGLTDKSDYKIQFKRGNFWIPFFQTPSINVHVSLLRPSKVSDNVKWQEPIKDLFVVTRQSGAWRITRINLKKSPLFEKYKILKPGTNSDSYISQKGNDVTINLKFNTENLTIVEKRKLQFILKRVGQLLN